MCISKNACVLQVTCAGQARYVSRIVSCSASCVWYGCSCQSELLREFVKYLMVLDSFLHNGHTHLFDQ